jgi:hypothetical protein
MMLNIRCTFVTLLFLLSAVAFAQSDTVQVTKNFRFRDGAYRSFADWQANKPSWPIDSLRVSAVTNPQTFLTQVEAIQHRNGTPLATDSLWGIVLDGIPYIRLPKGATPKSLAAFAGLRLRGIICSYRYEDIEERIVEIQAYNPVTGVPFRKGKVKNRETVEHEYILHFRTGETLPFTRDNLVAWINDDQRLADAIRDIHEADLPEKLFKGLLIYVDRYPVYTSK